MEASVGVVRMSDMDDALMALRWCVEPRRRSGARAYGMLAPLWAVVHSTAAAEVTALGEARAGAVGPRTHARNGRVLGVAAIGHFVLGQPELARARALEGDRGGGSDGGLIAASRARAGGVSLHARRWRSRTACSAV